MKTVTTLFAAALALVLQGAFAGAQAVNASGHCTGMTVTDFVSSDSDDQTGSTTWVNVTDGHLNLTTSSTGCVEITFSGLALVRQTSGTLTHLRVRTLMDGNNLCVPALTNDLFLLGDGPTAASANSITHVCKNVTAGAHTVQVQFYSQEGDIVEIVGHELTVTHN